MIRLFTGLSLPENLRARIQLIQGGIPGACWTALENYHITLTFIGEVDESVAEEVDEALSSVRAEGFSLKLKGTGSFAQGSWPKVLWLGVEAAEKLSLLKEKTDHAMKKRGVEFDARKYTPHVTLAYLKEPDEQMLGDFMQANNLFASEPFAVKNFILYRSDLTKNGPSYVPLRSYALV